MTLGFCVKSSKILRGFSIPARKEWSPKFTELAACKRALTINVCEVLAEVPGKGHRKVIKRDELLSISAYFEQGFRERKFV